MHYQLFYDYVDDIIKRRDPYRKEHLNLAKKHVKSGKLLLVQVFNDPLNGAIFLFQADSRISVETYAKEDPYVVNGLVIEWRVRECNIVLGALKDKIES